MNGKLISNKSYPTQPAHLDDYALVNCISQVYLGKCGALEGPWAAILPNAINMTDAYIVLGGYSPTEKGTIVRPRVLAPLEALASSKYLLVVPNAIFPIAQLDEEDRRQILKEIGDAEKRRVELRVKGAGLVLPGGG